MTDRPGAQEGPCARPRLLVVPHLYAENISVREIELARRLTRVFDVFILKWQDALQVEAASVLKRRMLQALVAARAAVHGHDQLRESDGTTIVSVPVWQPILLQRMVGPERALAICQSRNRRTLHGILRDLRITHLLLANQLFGVESVAGVRTFFDVVDWFPEDGVPAGRLKKIRSNLEEIGARVDGVFAVSELLCEKLSRECGLQPLPLANGADLQSLRGVEPSKVKALRQNLGIADKFAIGYIGNHGSFTGVDLVVNAFLAARSCLPEAALLIIGPAESWQPLLAANRSSGVIATGNVPPQEIAEYFNALDLGVLAQGRTTGTDYAFQIKVVEYTACRKCVISTPLLTWQRLAWPNVFLTEPTIAAWGEAFVRARSTPWQPEWDRLVEPYDWRVLADRAAKIMLG